MTHDDPKFDRIRTLGGDLYASYIAAGYRESCQRQAPHSTPFLLQKAIYRDNVKAYFVNVWAYDHSGYLGDHPFGMLPEVQYNTHGDQDPTFNVEYMGKDLSPAAVEAFFAAIYERMGCQPYGDD